MERVVYKFLDIYLGDEVVCQPVNKPNNSNDWYIIRSTKNNQRIFDFFVTQKNGKLGLGFFSDSELCSTVKGYCGIDNPDHCSKYIKDWFGYKHGINKVSDVLKFLPNS